MTRRLPTAFVLLSLLLGGSTAARAEPAIDLRKGDHVAYIGNNLADRMQHHAWLETYLHALHPNHALVFRNLGFPGDELTNRNREPEFGSPDQWLTKVGADVVFCFFGRNEALRGPDGVAGFEKDLADVIDRMQGQKYNGESAPRLVFFSPIAHENLFSRHLPDGKAHNANLRLYAAAMQKVCAAKEVPFVDLFAMTWERYGERTAKSRTPYTINGVHLTDDGNRSLAKWIVQSEFAGRGVKLGESQLERLNEAVREKNYEWFSRYRVVDGYNVFGGRSRLAWFGQSNADVMKREMEIFDVKTANRDRRVWAVANGGDLEVKDDNLPGELVVRTNKPGGLDGGKYPYVGAEAAIERMTVAEGMEVNLFASEEEFPRLVNPVQMAVDPDGRLFASVWPSYPHWNPTEPRRDAIVMLPDDDGDGKADRCVVFADELNSVTAFEFWNGGMIVAALPELWFLKDTDGDDVADVRIRMLQGLSSADSHHSANAMLLGPDGWIYWSRGIFNVATMETPTGVYRSGQTGVHRFNPRTFEMEFHFPIGPNPHGDVFDEWGYQFANDGTSGTGSHVNIGKGIGHEQWFKKRVRPVPATGMIASSHFPEANRGNFLICNAIGVLGVLQHEVKYEGARITAEEVEPIVLSSDPNFRPSDVEIGGDGALYVADWHNALIGHMQHNMRDPNRDATHGRIYRVTAKGRQLVRQPRMRNRSIPEVCRTFLNDSPAFRYRARIELSGRPEIDLVRDVGAFANALDVSKPAEAQAALECLWVFEEQRLPNPKLLAKVFEAAEPRVRAAAIRTLGHWGVDVDDWERLLVAAARDDAPLVRAEAVKSAVAFEGMPAAEAIFEAANRPTDPELDTVLKYARSRIPVDQYVKDALANGKPLSPAAEQYALANAPAETLLKLERSDAVYRALLHRSGIPAKFRWEAVEALAKKSGRSDAEQLIAAIDAAEDREHPSIGDLAKMLAEASDERLAGSTAKVAALADATGSSPVRTAAYAAWMRTGEPADAWDHAVKARHTLRDLLDAVPAVTDDADREALFTRIRPLVLGLPEHLESAEDDVVARGPSVSFEYYQPNPDNVANETLDRLKPSLTGKIPNFAKYVPKGATDGFATRQTAAVNIPATGSYTFSTISDDGSRLYIDGKQIVDNDGLHGPVEKSGTVALDAGLHEIVVTYFENGGGDDLRVLWSGPGIPKQRIPADALRPSGSGNLRAKAIDVIAGWNGHLDEKVEDFTELVAHDDQTLAALRALARLPVAKVVDRLSPAAVAGILAAVMKHAANATPVERQSEEYDRLLGFGERLVTRIEPEAERDTQSIALGRLRASIPVKADPRVMALGREVYTRESHCKTCHQVHGQGLPNLYPPIDGSLWATGNPDRLIALALDGMHGTIEVKGKRYSSPPLPPMTGFRQLLNDEELAAVLTYVRNTWSNRAQPITPAQVAAIRKLDRGDEVFWYAPDLMKKYPLEDGRQPIESGDPNDRWIPKFVKKWTYADLDATKLTEGGRSYATGKLYFKRLGCVQCHRLNDMGGVFGPDLAKLDEKKHDPAYILRAILEPSKDVEPKYATRSFVLTSGKVLTGLIAKETDDAYHVVTDPLAPDKLTVVKREDIDDESTTRTSIMPEGMLNWLTEDEILDLLTYVHERGDEGSPLFRKP